jgi:hypothetical protein
MTTHGKVQFRSSVGPAGCRRRLAGSGTGDEKRGREPFRRLSRHHRRLAEKGDADLFGDFPIANFAWREKRGRESVRLLCSRHPRLASSQAKDRKLPAESLPVFLASKKVRVPFFETEQPSGPEHPKRFASPFSVSRCQISVERMTPIAARSVYQKPSCRWLT